MIARCHYKNGGVLYHEIPVPVGKNLNGLRFKIPEPYPVSLGTMEEALHPPKTPIHTFQYHGSSEVAGEEIPVFYEI